MITQKFLNMNVKIAKISGALYDFIQFSHSCQHVILQADIQAEIG